MINSVTNKLAISGRLKSMVSLVQTAIFCSLVFFVLANDAQAVFTPQMNYQGKLTNASGNSVTDGDYNFQFRLCADSSCSSVLATETYTGASKITVTGGLFSVMLGQTADLTAIDFNQPLYLEVQVGGTGVPAFETLLPRKVLGAVPNAFNAAKFDGLATTSFFVSNVTGTGNLIVSGASSLATTTMAFNSSIGTGGTNFTVESYAVSGTYFNGDVPLMKFNSPNFQYTPSALTFPKIGAMNQTLILKEDVDNPELMFTAADFSNTLNYGQIIYGTTSQTFHFYRSSGQAVAVNIPGTLFVGNIAVANSTSSGYLTVGTAPANANFSSGSLNVQNNLVVGGSVSSTSLTAGTITLGGVARTTWPSGSGGSSFDQWLDTTNTPTFAGLNVTANATTSGYLTVGTAPSNAIFANGNINVQNNGIFGGYVTTTGGLFTMGNLSVQGTSYFNGLISGTGFDTSVMTSVNARKGVVNGIASLGADGKVPDAQLSALAITNTYVVTTTANMLALAATMGDVAIVTDISKSYILRGSDPTLFSDWEQLRSPTDAVISVNGDTGTVTLSTDDISIGSTNFYYTQALFDADIADIKGVANGLASLGADGKIPSSQLDGISLNDTFVVGATSSLLTAGAVKGDLGVVTTTNKTYILQGTDGTVWANWVEISNSGAVTSVNAKTGAVTLTTDDITEGAKLYWSQSLFDTALVSTSTWDGDLHVYNGNVGIGIVPNGMALEVMGNASTSLNIYAGKNIYLGHNSSLDNIIDFDDGSATLLWSKTNQRFEFSTSTFFNGHVLIDDYLTVGSDFGGANYGLGNLNVQNNGVFGGYVSSSNLFVLNNATTTGYLTVGSAPSGANFTAGNLNVQLNTVIGASLSVGTTLGAGTTTVTSLSVTDNSTSSFAGWLNIGTVPAGANFSSGNLNVQNNIAAGGTVSSTKLFITGSATTTGNTFIAGRVEIGNTTTTPVATSTKVYIEYQSGYGLRLYNQGSSSDPVIYEQRNGARLTAGGQWVGGSSRTIKENFEQLGEGSVLDKINSLELVKYNYIIESDSVKHFGAMAEDWYSVFGLGDDNKTIAISDVAFVALQGIQELMAEVKALKSQIDEQAPVAAADGGDPSAVVVTDPDSSRVLVVDPIADSHFDITIRSSKLEGNLLVKGASSFYGTVTVIGQGKFSSKVVFQDHTYYDRDAAGVVVVPAGATSTEVVFVKPYEWQPVITVTPRADMAGKDYWVVDQSIRGFRIAVNPVSSSSAEFNWHAIAVDGYVAAMNRNQISGCTDSSAGNYDSLATQDDGSCLMNLSGGEDGQDSNNVVIVDNQENESLDESINDNSVRGCIDPQALNFNADAEQDDGSCTYATITVQEQEEPSTIPEPEALTDLIENPDVVTEDSAEAE